MLIAVDGIPTTGREVAFGLREGWAVEAATASLEAPPTTLSGVLGVHRVSKKGLVRVEVQVTAKSEVGCDRCAQAVFLSVDETLTLLYAPEETGGSTFDGGEIELGAEDLDVGWYIDGNIDLGHVLREAVALGLPSRNVCTDPLPCDMRTSALLAASSVGSSSSVFAQLATLKSSSSDEV